MSSQVNFSISELKKLQKKLEKLQEPDAQNFVEACAKELAARMLALVTKNTPTGDKPKLKGPEMVSVKGASGETRTFLSREAAILQEYWSGYMGGTLKRGWTARTHEEAAHGHEEPTARQAKSWANSLTVNHVGDMLQITITNPVEYASYVEYGHRQTPGRYVPALGKRLKKGWSDGKFMMTISEQKIQNIAPKVLEKKIEKILKECMQC